MKTCTITGCKQEAQLFCDPASETVKFKMPEGPSETFTLMKGVKRGDVCYYHGKFPPRTKPTKAAYNPLDQLF